mmetsp:Transcript_119007/g.210398  ORF Transcript_119007/g.210398 Transcript_119007/m.210398 type:complete len:990 (-) Transcript_119007:59-3028(-)
MHLVLRRRLVTALLALAFGAGAVPTTRALNSGHLRHGAVALLSSSASGPAAEDGAAADVDAAADAGTPGSPDSALREAEMIATEVQDPPAVASSVTASDVPLPAVNAADPLETPAPSSAMAGLHEDPANADVIDETERLAAQAEAEAASDSGSDASEAAAAAALRSVGLAEADLDGADKAAASPTADGTSPPAAQPAAPSTSAAPHAKAGSTQGQLAATMETAAPASRTEAPKAAAKLRPAELTAAPSAPPPTRPAPISAAPVMMTAGTEHHMLRANHGRKARQQPKDKEPVPPGIASHPGEPLEEEVDEEISAADEAKEEEDEMLAAEKAEEQNQEEEEKAQDRKLEEEEEELQRREERFDREEAEHAREKQTGDRHSSREIAQARSRSERHEMDQLEERIARDTNSSALAEMLSLIKLDSYQLNDKADILQKEIEDGVELAPEDPNDSLIYPLSTCMRCCIMVAAQYFIVYTAMAICKAFTTLFDLGEATKTEKALSAAFDTVYYAPMLCVLFLGAQLRALQITAGKGGPQDWAEVAMEASAWCLLVQTLLVLATSLITRDEQDSGSESASLIGLFTLLRYVSLIGLYVGFTVVCVAVLLMDARSLGAKPVDLWDNPTTAETEYSPPVSVAMTCIMTLTVFFFTVHLAHALLWSCVELAGGPASPRAGSSAGRLRTFVVNFEKCLRLCMSAVDLAPILCALLIAVRMRALQLEPKYGRPQSWVEACFYVIVACLISQPVLIVLLTLTGGLSEVTSVRRGDCAPEIVEDLDSQPMRILRRIVVVVNYLNMTVMYSACFAILVGVFLLEARPGKPTPPVSPTMFCVIMLATLHLGTYLSLFLSQIFGRAQHIFKMAEQAVKLGPMLAVLFLGTRMRALQLSKQEGSPQCWAQDAMYMAVMAVVAEICLVLVVSVFIAEAGTTEAKGQVSKSIPRTPHRIAVQLLQVAFFLLLHGSVIVVVAAALTVRPETASCAKRGFPGLNPPGLRGL